MKILYIFPHPDDESFGPAAAMAKQRREGHDVYLLTLTKGGATRQRHKYGYSVDEMGDVRYREMMNVSKTLNLSGMTVLDFPDSGLKHLDPRDIEEAIIEEMELVHPAVVVSYPVHGISGFHDHLVTHAVVKRAFIELSEQAEFLKRLALYTITEDQAAASKHFPLSGSTEAEIDCIETVSAADIESAQRALDCYVTFQETIEKTGVRDMIGENVHFELFDESFDPQIEDLFDFS